MLGARLVIVVAALSQASLVLADLLPPQPKPPPPKGPAKAVVRGVTLEQAYKYLRGRRWLTVVGSCPERQAGCAKVAKAENICVVTGIDGKDVEPGRLDLIQAADKAAAGRALSLTVDCGTPGKLDLAP